MSSYRERQDQRIANDVGQDAELMCRAHGCPNRWSVTAENGNCCTAHAWSDQRYWPQITQEQLDSAADRALRLAAKVGQPEPVPNVRRLRAELAKVGDSIRASRQSPKRWAWQLKSREEQGEKLTDNQRKAWRDALHYQVEPQEMEQAA